MSCECCGDNRFKIIAKAKENLLKSTNIETNPEEMAVLDGFLFRCWQMGWLNKYDNSPSKDTAQQGHWVEVPTARDDFSISYCSVCGKMPYAESNYCPNCGAQMNKTLQSRKI